MRTLTININHRYPLSCRHCSLGFSTIYHGDGWKLTHDELNETVRQVDPELYSIVLMAGGEPSLDPDLIRTGIAAAQTAGCTSAVVTAPIWARSPKAAADFLSAVDGLGLLILSYDDYHLEFLSIDHYRNAVSQAVRRGIPVVFQLAYDSDDERERLKESLGGMRTLAAAFHATRTVGVGNGASSDATGQGVLVKRDEDLDAIPRSCELGNSFVDYDFSVHGCCWSTASTSSPFRVASDDGARTVTTALRRLEGEPLFQRVRSRGFLDSLTREARRAAVDLVRGETVRSECDLCVRAMNAADSPIWEVAEASHHGK